MRISRTSVFAVLIASVAWVCPTLSAQTADEKAIRAAIVEWAQAISDKDVDKSVSFYADDAHMYPFNAPRTETKEDIRKTWSGLFSEPGSALQIKTTGVFVAKAGDLAYETGTFELKGNNAQGHTGTTPGKYVVVWKKQGKEWKAVADIFNTDK